MPAPEVTSYPIAITWSSASRDRSRYQNAADYVVDLPVELYNVREIKFGSIEATSVPLHRNGVNRKFEVDEGQLVGAGLCSKTSLNLNQFAVVDATTGVETVYDVPCRNNPSTLALSISGERATVTVTTAYGHGLTLGAVAKVKVTLCCSRLLAAAQPIVNKHGLASNVTIVDQSTFTLSNVPILLDTVGFSAHNATLHSELLTSEDLKRMFNGAKAGLVTTEVTFEALRFVLSPELKLPSADGSLGAAVGSGGVVPVSSVIVPFVSGMESMLRDTVQRANGIVLTSAAVFGYTNTSGVTAPIAVPAGTYSPSQMAAVLRQLIASFETTTVTVNVTCAEIEGPDRSVGLGFTIAITHNNTTHATDPTPMFAMHFSPFSQYGWAPTSSSVSTQIALAARLLGFSSGCSATSFDGIIRSSEPSSYGSTTPLGERKFKWQYNVMGDVVDRRVVVSARSVPTTELSCTVNSIMTDQTILTASPTSTPLAAHLGDVVLLSKNGGTGVTVDSITTSVVSAQITEMSGTTITMVCCTDNLNAMAGETPTATSTVTLLASVLDTPRMTVVPTGIGLALGYTKMMEASSATTANAAWVLEDPSASSMLLSITPDGAVEGAVENANHVLTGPNRLHKCLTRITVRRSDEMLAMTSSAISEAQASVARLNRVRVSFKNIDGSICEWSDTEHLLTIVVRCDPAKTASRIPLMS